MLVEPLTELVFVIIVQILSLSKHLRLVVGFGMERTVFKLFSLLLQVKHLGIKLLLALRQPLKELICLLVKSASRLRIPCTAVGHEGTLLEGLLFAKGILYYLSVLFVVGVLVQAVVHRLVVHADA